MTMATPRFRLAGRPTTLPALPASPTAERTTWGARLAGLWSWPQLALAVIVLGAAFLNLYRLDMAGYGNSYYAAAVRSMLQSWRNFFFASFDPGSFVAVDKPPVALWVQTAFAKLFGFRGTVLLLPQALAGIASVVVLAALVRRAFGVGAGLLAALALAVTPVLVATDRTNELDSQLVLVVLLGAWALLRASETGRLRWLLLSMAIIGLGFNIKMLQAYLVLPAFYLVYLLGSPRRWLTRLGQLALASVVLLAVSLSWAVIVDLTPKDQRPFVGSSATNSAINLALGYNGLNRLLGRGPGPNGARPADRPADAPANPALTGQPPAQVNAPANPQRAGQPAVAGVRPNDQPFPPGGPIGGPGGGENGEKGALRLFNRQLAGQASWLLPLALVGLVAAGSQARPRSWRALLPPWAVTDRQAQSLMLWGMWLATTAGFFSVAGFYHRYYLVMLAPAVAALAAIGAVALWRSYRADWRLAWALPLALAGTALVQLRILDDYDTWQARLAPAIIALTALAIALLALGRWRPALLAGWRSLVVVALAGPALLLAPVAWAGITVWEGGNSMLPAAGPNSGFGLPGGPARANRPAAQPTDQPAGAAPNVISGGRRSIRVNESLIAYLQANRGDAKYLVATPSSMTAGPIIITTGEPVMALGGFSGGDQILTSEQLAEKVKAGEVRFFLLGGPGGPGGFPGPNAADDAPRRLGPNGQPVGPSGFAPPGAGTASNRPAGAQGGSNPGVPPRGPGGQADSGSRPNGNAPFGPGQGQPGADNQPPAGVNPSAGAPPFGAGQSGAGGRQPFGAGQGQPPAGLNPPAGGPPGTSQPGAQGFAPPAQAGGQGVPGALPPFGDDGPALALGPGGRNAATSWVTANCALVPASTYTATGTSATVPFAGFEQLFDCIGAR